MSPKGHGVREAGTWSTTLVLLFGGIANSSSESKFRIRSDPEILLHKNNSH